VVHGSRDEEGDEIKNKLLIASGEEGRTICHMAAKKGNLEPFQKIQEWVNPLIPELNPST